MSAEAPRFYPTRQENLIAAVQGFNDVLADTRARDIVPLYWDGFVDGLDHNGRVSDEIAVPRRNGVYLPQDQLGSYAAAGLSSPALVGFTMRENLQATQIGDRKYAHEVFMGELSITWGRRKAENVTSSNVAVKVLEGEDGIKRGLHEVALQHYVADIGLPTIQTVALVVSGNKLYHVTEYEPMWVYDKINWPKLDEQTQDQLINTGLRGLQAMHAKKLFHRDAGLRNIGTSQRKNGFVIFDCEQSGSFAFADLDYFEFVSLVERDLRSYAYSFESEKAIQPKDYCDRYEQYFRRILHPYRQLAVKLQEEDPMRLWLIASADSISEFWAAKARKNNLGLAF